MPAREELELELEAKRRENDALKGATSAAHAPSRSLDLDGLEAELLQLRSENRDLRLKAGANMTKDDDELIFEEYLLRLGQVQIALALDPTQIISPTRASPRDRQVLTMRHAGRSEPKVFEAYNEALVQLSDEGLKEMYLNFMLIYMGEYTEEVLERCQVDEVRVCMPPNGPHATATPRARAPPSRPPTSLPTPLLTPPRRCGSQQVTEEVLGFSEMATMRIGQLLDQPRAVRIQSLQEPRPRARTTGAHSLPLPSPPRLLRTASLPPLPLRRPRPPPPSPSFAPLPPHLHHRYAGADGSHAKEGRS